MVFFLACSVQVVLRLDETFGGDSRADRTTTDVRERYRVRRGVFVCLWLSRGTVARARKCV